MPMFIVFYTIFAWLGYIFGYKNTYQQVRHFPQNERQALGISDHSPRNMIETSEPKTMETEREPTREDVIEAFDSLM